METATTMTEHECASNAKANTGLGFGIAGTALGILNALGTGWLGTHMNGSTSKDSGTISGEENYIERKQAQDYLNITKEFYEGKLSGQKALADAFFDAYKRDVDNSFGLYKNQRDMNDALQKEQHDNFDILNQKITDASFGLYKNQRDEKDALTEKINALQSKVDVMAAVRPYQDALINCKIDKNALLADYNLSKRTCRMIEGQLVLPDNLISGFTSYNPTIIS